MKHKLEKWIYLSSISVFDDQPFIFGSEIFGHIKFFKRNITNFAHKVTQGLGRSTSWWLKYYLTRQKILIIQHQISKPEPMLLSPLTSNCNSMKIGSETQMRDFWTNGNVCLLWPITTGIKSTINKWELEERTSCMQNTTSAGKYMW